MHAEINACYAWKASFTLCTHNNISPTNESHPRVGAGFWREFAARVLDLALEAVHLKERDFKSTSRIYIYIYIYTYIYIYIYIYQNTYIYI